MMNWYVLGMTLVALAGCSKAPESGAGDPDIGGNAVAGVAFDYSYALALPSTRIGDLQEEHARACERLGIARCRITGLRYSVSKQGDVDASLSVKIAAPIARGFGREGVKRAENMGATLTGTDISGTDVATAAAATDVQRSDLASDRARVARDLSRPDLSPRERTELLQQQAALAEPTRAAAAGAAAQRDSLANTPMTFAYRTGRGTGLMDRLRDAGDTALGSIGLTVTALLWVVAALGPPLVVIALLFLLWRRWGQRWWVGLVERAERA
jgi:hypothetical protein